MESEMVSQRDYYLLSVDIFKTLSLSREHRPVPAKDYLEKCYNIYCRLVESSNTMAKRVEDKLCPLPIAISSVASSTPRAGVSSSGDIELGLTL
jgi:hypothetical protein